MKVYRFSVFVTLIVLVLTLLSTSGFAVTGLSCKNGPAAACSACCDGVDGVRPGTGDGARLDFISDYLENTLPNVKSDYETQRTQLEATNPGSARLDFIVDFLENTLPNIEPDYKNQKSTFDVAYCKSECPLVAVAQCGNAVKEGTEQCDFGTAHNDDADKSSVLATYTAFTAPAYGQSATAYYCSDQCVSRGSAEVGPSCGDSDVQAANGEVCDDGNTVGGDYCSATCGVTGACGDGTQQSNEACDDGNTANGDYCSSSCTQVTGSCGDGQAQSNEQCDDGNTNTETQCTQYGRSEAFCSANCQTPLPLTGGLACPRCGDGVAQATSGETCDGADMGALTAAQLACSDADGYVGELQQCNPTCTGPDTSSTACTLTESCGDGVIQGPSNPAHPNGPETCDGGALNGDANQCNAQCDAYTLAVCGNGVLETVVQEACEPGVDPDGAGPLQPWSATACTPAYGATCTWCSNDAGQCRILTEEGPRCGDGITQPNEECDPADSATATLACDADVAGLTYSGLQTCHPAGAADVAGASIQCTYSQCVTAQSCGDNALNGNEQCDIVDSVATYALLESGDAQSCEANGYTAGALGCDPSACIVDLAQCTYLLSVEKTEPALPTLVSASTGTVLSEPVGIDCGDDCGEEHVAGTRVRLYATLTRNGLFGGWENVMCAEDEPDSVTGVAVGSSADACTVTVDEAKSATAVFSCEEGKYRLLDNDGTECLGAGPCTRAQTCKIVDVDGGVCDSAIETCLYQWQEVTVVQPSP